MVHSSTELPLGTAALRDLTEDDIEAVVRYWFTSSDEFLDFMGVDRTRLGTEEQTRQRFLSAIRTGDPDQKTIVLAIMLNAELIGYPLLNRYAPETNYSHWHIINPNLRGAGISTALYPHRIKAYFDLVPIERLIHQTRTRNVAVNRCWTITCQLLKPVTSSILTAWPCLADLICDMSCAVTSRGFSREARS